MRLSNFIAKALLGGLFVNVLLNGKYYHVKAPTVKTLIRMMEQLDIALMSDFVKLSENIDNSSEKQLKDALSIAAGVKNIEAERDELILAMNELLAMTFAAEYFRNIPKVTKPKKPKDTKSSYTGGKTISSQITSFMEDLNMSLHEVLEMPYPTLLMLQHDKIRPDYSPEKDKTEEISGAQMLTRKRR